MLNHEGSTKGSVVQLNNLISSWGRHTMNERSGVLSGTATTTASSTSDAEGRRTYGSDELQAEALMAAAATVDTPGSRRTTAAPEGNDFREKRIQQTDLDELIQALGGLSLEKDYWMHVASLVRSDDPEERYEGTRKFRMMLSASGEIPIQDVIDMGVVPYFAESLDMDSQPLQFEAAWALTNIASGTSKQTEVVVGANAIPRFLRLLSAPREDSREQGMWGLGNIAGDRAEYRDEILSYQGTVNLFLTACKQSRRPSTIRTGVWSLSNLCRGKPRPMFHMVKDVIPYLAFVLSTSTDADVLSDACWALDGLSEQPSGIQKIINSGAVPHLVNLLSHEEVVVQRPALRVIGQIATGNAEQTQAVIDQGCLPPLTELLSSSRRSIRKDACWTLSNIAAGAPHQLQALLSCGTIPHLVRIFHFDEELEVKKEAAWALCNACTTTRHDQLEYLISTECIRPVCEMLSIDDPKILEVVLEALENIVKFGAKSAKQYKLDHNPCVAVIRAADGVARLGNLHFSADHCGSYFIWQKSGEMLKTWFADDLGMMSRCVT